MKKSEIKNNKRKKRAWVLPAFFLLVYTPSIVYWIYGGSVSIDRIRNGTVENSINTNVIAVRDSVLYSAGYDGVFIPELEDGEKAGYGFRIASVYRESAYKYLDDLKDKGKKIIEAKEKRFENTKLFDADIKKIVNDIESRLIQLAQKTRFNSIHSILPLQEEINSLVKKKSLILGESGSTDVYIKSLEEDLKKLRQKVNLNKQDIISKDTGIISFFVDGYEELLSIDTIDKLTSSIINKIGYVPCTYGGENLIRSGEPFAKVIKGIEYYLVAVLNERDAIEFKTGDTYTVRINDIQKETNAVVAFSYSVEKGDHIIVFRVNRYMSDTINMRKMNADLLLSKYEGLIVLKRSLIQPDYEAKTAGIMLAKGNYASYREVKIKGWNREMAVIEDNEEHEGGIYLYDSYLINPKNIKDGQIIRNE